MLSKEFEAFEIELKKDENQFWKQTDEVLRRIGEIFINFISDFSKNVKSCLDLLDMFSPFTDNALNKFRNI